MIFKKFFLMKPSFKRNLFFYAFILSSISLLIFTIFFFSHFLSFNNKENVLDISDNWELNTISSSKKIPIANLKKLGKNTINEPFYLSKVLEEVDGIDTLMIKSSYQYIRVYLNETKLFETPFTKKENLGIGLYFIQLPAEYGHKTLHIEIISPYSTYTKTSNPIYLGTISSLYAFIFSKAFPNLFYLFTCFITGLFLILYSAYSYLKGKKEMDKLCLGFFSILWGVYCISWDNIACLFFSPAAISQISALLHIIYLIPFFIYVHLNFTIYHKLTSTLLVIFCSSAGVMCLFSFLSILDFANTVLIYNYILDAIFLPMIVIACIEFKRKNSLIRFLFPSILLVIIGVIGTILEQYTTVKGIFFYLLSIFIFICFNWIYHLKQILNQRIQEKKEFQTLRLKNNLILDRYDEMQTNLKKTRIIRHEMNHHITAIQILCNEKDIDGIQQYLLSISSNILIARDIFYSNHPIVDCILSNYISQCKKQNIQFDYSINLPNSLPIPDSDLCSLLLNMLDNAIEASVLPPNKWIIFKMSLKENFLIISCQNSYCGDILEEDDTITTQKEEKEFHGYGIPIMKSIVKKYGSTLIISYDSDCFTVKTILQFS